MRLRFVTGNDLVSAAIRAREGEAAKYIRFVPSHTEAVVQNPDGTLGYLGAHADGGVTIRPVGYDRATLLEELFLEVPLAPAGEAAALAWAFGKIGAPYDFAAILDFLLPTTWHEMGHLICSAFMTLTAIKGGAFPGPLAKPAHTVSPLDLLFLFSGRMAIPAVN